MPRFGLRKYRKSSRIFQDLTVPEIARSILAEAGVAAEMRLQRAHPPRVYCTQYEETDTDFVSRLLAEEGIFSFWVPPAVSPDEVEALDPKILDGDTLVLGDTEAAYQEVATPWLPYLAAEGTGGGAAGRVTRFVSREAVRPARATFREYEASRLRTALEAEAAVAGGAESALEVYDHNASFQWVSWNQTQGEPIRRLQAAQRKAALARGESTAPHLAAGHHFKLEDHPWEQANGPHVVLEVHHEGWSTPEASHPDRYRNRFVTAPASVPVPPRMARPRSLGLTLTATVTGPPGEEIHTDEHGRVKVQFHWDREGKVDDRSSCWLAVMQAWAGASFGSQFIPRVGMEVVVSFEGGDPDKPLVLGCIPNVTHPPPFSLPGSKTKSGLRTQSSPGSGGFNELSFEDRAGQERVYVFAQRDLEEVVTNNRTRVVRANEQITVQGAAQRTVSGNHDETVKGDHTQRVLGAQQLHVAGPHQAAYASEWSTAVAGRVEMRVTGAHTLRVEGEHRTDIGGSSRQETRGDVIDRTLGSHALVVGAAGSPRALTLHAEGTATLRGSDELVLESAKTITLRVGKTMIRLTEHGIELHGDTVVVSGKEGSMTAGDDGLTLRTRKKAEIAADSVLVHTTGEAAVIAMQKEVKVAGSKILLNSPEQARDARPEDPLPPTVIRLLGEDGVPIPHQPYVLRLDGKRERAGVLDDQGRAEIHLDPAPGEAMIRFPDLPAPRMERSPVLVPHVVQAGEYLDKIANRLGFPPETLWQDDKNTDLRALRPNPNLLSAGDVLWIPRDRATGEEPAHVGAENTFTRRVPSVQVVMWLRRADGSPLANEPCEVRGIGLTATSDAAGKIELRLPVHMTSAELWVPSLQITQTVLVGHLDPKDTPAGLKQRLANLGYDAYHGFEDAPGEAIRRFQKDHGLPETGGADAETLAALERAHDQREEE